MPNIAALGPHESRKRVVSKPLRRLMDNYDRQTFVGPPENVRDHVMAAVRALAAGDWRTSYALLSGLACWALLPAKDEVLAMLCGKLQVRGLWGSGVWEGEQEGKQGGWGCPASG